MYDMKTLYFTNIIESYYNYGYETLNTYDKYHIVLIIVSSLTYDYNCNLGEFIKNIRLPIQIMRQFPVLGINQNSEYNIPSLYNLSMSVVKNQRIYGNNNYYNRLIIRSPELLKVSDKSNYINEYIMKIYSKYERFIVEHLIEQYTRQNYTINTFYTINNQLNNIEEYEVEDIVNYEEYESEYEQDIENDY